MNRGERSTITKAAKMSAEQAERRAVLRLISAHRHLLRATLDEGPSKNAAVKVLNVLEEQVSWGWHRENRS